MTAPGSDATERARSVHVAVTPAPPLRGDPRGRPLSRMEWASLAAYARLGDQVAAATSLGIRYQTLKNHLAGVYRKLGVDGAALAFRAVGWLRLPGDTALERERQVALAEAMALREAVDRYIASQEAA